MVFKIFWTEHAKRSLNKLQRDDIIRIIKKVEATKVEPYRFLKKLVGERAWRLRAGDWRALIDIDNERETLYVLEVGHRKKIYKL